jgi:hypothetical protein
MERFILSYMIPEADIDQMIQLRELYFIIEWILNVWQVDTMKTIY